MGSRMSGAAVALPIWAEFMRRAHTVLGLPVEDFVLPEDIPQSGGLWGDIPGGVYLLF